MESHRLMFSIAAVVDDEEAIDSFFESINCEACKRHGEVILIAQNAQEVLEKANRAVEALRASEAEEDGEPCSWNITAVESTDEGYANDYNKALKSVRGRWVLFTFVSASYSANALSKALAAIETPYKICENEDGVLCKFQSKAYEKDGEARVVCMTPFVHNKLGENLTSYRMRCRRKGIVDLDYYFNSINLALFSVIVPTETAKEIGFDEDCPYEFEHEFLLRLYLKERCVYYCKDSKTYLPRKSETALSNYEHSRLKGWYIDSAQMLLKLLDEAKETFGEIPKFLQIIVYYLIVNKYDSNYFERDTGTLNREEAFEFDEICRNIFKLLDDKVIFANYKVAYSVSPQIQMHSIKAKYDCLDKSGGTHLPYHPEILNDNLFFVPNGKNVNDFEISYNLKGGVEYQKLDSLIYLTNFKNEAITVQDINCIDDKLEFDLRISDEYLYGFDSKFIAVAADEYNGESTVSEKYKAFDLIKEDIYSSYKCFGVTLTKFKRLHLSVPCSEIMGKKLVFAIEYCGIRYALNIKYIRGYSRLSGGRFNYWMFAKHKFARPVLRGISFEKCGPFKHFLYETAFMADNLIRGKGLSFKDRLYCIILRLLADILHPVLKRKNIWLTFDKLYKGGDNGEYMFDYLYNHKTGVNCYYIISPDAIDCKRLKAKYGKKVLIHQSFRQRLLALNAQAILATHATATRYYGINNSMLPILKDKLKAPTICIQHGLTIQKIAQYQSRIFDNTRLYCLASKYEWENICNSTYGYTADNLRMTGLARYDGLKSNDKRQILITPTWRRNVVNSGIAFQKKTHNDSFKNTEYFRIYNSLINDSKLIECAKRNNYRLIYLLHPAMSAQAEDFDRNDYVELVQATGEMNYEKILTESSLMLTDYSGVQFDFAYQRKALVYYHPDTLPPHYDPGKINYETMGFGPICRTHEQIVNTLCEYMDNNCENPQEYVRRADDFFAFRDHNNCKRIYECVSEFISKEKASNNNNLKY